MKKLFLLFIFLAITLQAQLQFVDSYPADGATNVQVTDTIRVTFNEALDVENGVRYHETFFTNVDTSGVEIWFSADQKSVFFKANLNANKNYFLLFYSAKAADGSMLDTPFLIRFTTDTVFSGNTVSGNVSFRDNNSPELNTMVALLPEKLGNNEPRVLFAGLADSNGLFSIDNVPNGVYYPIAVKDVNSDGEINPDFGDLIGSGDSVVVENSDVAGIEIILGEIQREGFRRAKALLDSLKNGAFPPNLVLFFVHAWGVDSLAQASGWEFMFLNTFLHQAYSVEITPFGRTIDLMDMDFFNWVRHFRALGDSLSSAVIPDSFLTRIERRFGRAFRNRTLPDSLRIEVELSLGDVSRFGFGDMVPDTNRFYWGLRYRISNPNRDGGGNIIPQSSLYKASSILSGDEGRFLADYKTGNEVNVTNVKQENGLTPKKYSLYQNYPNPFNPSTKIKYQIPSSGHVSLKVYDILGNEVANLVNENQSTGNYEVNFNASGLTSGIYFYQLNSGGFTQVNKMMLIK